MRDYQSEIDAARNKAAQKVKNERMRQEETQDDLDEFIEKWNMSIAPVVPGMMAMDIEAWKRKVVALELELNELAKPSDSMMAPSFVGYIVHNVNWAETNVMDGFANRRVRFPTNVEGIIYVDFIDMPPKKLDNDLRLLVAQRTGMISQHPQNSLNMNWKFSYQTIQPENYNGPTPAVIVVQKEWVDEWV